MKKILVIAPYPYLPYFSGGQKSLALFYEYLGKETELTVISTTGNDWSLAKNYKTKELLKKPFSRYYDLSLIKKISNEVTSNKYDTVIWEHPYFAWLAFKVRKRTGIKTIIHTHNIEHQRFRSTGRWWWPILKHYEKWCFKKADCILFITPEDRNFAIDKWKIEKEKCFNLPYGVELNNYPADKQKCREEIIQKHHLDAADKIILFNGLLNYKPNFDAVTTITNEINPLLLQEKNFNYKIIICGKGLPDNFNSLKAYENKNIIYAGYVDDIDLYFKSADIFLNPILSGGGIKTKMVDAIANGATVIATETGATGINKTVCGNKLVTTADNDWKAFASAIIKSTENQELTPSAFYEYYYWGNIVKKISQVT
jgi:glycosyltransferase involved in cell wall biosynthesis